MRVILVIYAVIISILIVFVCVDYVASLIKFRKITIDECKDNISFLQLKLHEIAIQSESGDKIPDYIVEGYLDALDEWERKLKKLEKLKCKRLLKIKKHEISRKQTETGK